MNNIVVIGGGGHAKVLCSILLKNGNYKIIGYTDKVNKGDLLGTVKYLGGDEILPGLIDRNVCKFAVLAVGQVDLNTRRPGIAKHLLEMGYIFPPIISKDSIVNKDVNIGNGTAIFDGVVINSGATIGEFAILNSGAIIEHDCLIGNFTHIAPGVVLSGGVKVKEDSMVGAGATVLQNIEIGSHCLIGAGAIVVKNCSSYKIYAGVPAKPIREVI